MYRHIKFEYIKEHPLYRKHLYYHIYIVPIYNYLIFIDQFKYCCEVWTPELSEPIGLFRHLRQAKLYVRCNLDKIISDICIKELI